MKMEIARIIGLFVFLIISFVFLDRAMKCEDSRQSKKLAIVGLIASMCMCWLGGGWSPGLFVPILAIICMGMSLHEEK